MKTPSLERRIVTAGVGLVLVLCVGLDVLLYVSLRARLMSGVRQAHDVAAAVVRAEVALAGTDDLVSRLEDSGIPARIRTPEGGVVETRPATSRAEKLEPLSWRDVRLDDGTVVEVGASRAEVDRSLGRLLRLELILTPLVVVLAFLLLRFITELALRPLHHIAEAARRTAGGEWGERLRPESPQTRLGQMASAYDEMLDALEAALAGARAAQARSDRLVERNRQILETAHEAFVAMDEQGLIIDWNQEAERTFGWSRVEAIGRPVAETVIPSRLRARHRAGLEHYLLHGTGAMLGRRVELNGLHRNGHEFPVEMTVWETQHEGYSSFNAFIRDVTDRKKAEETASRLAAIVESSDAAMLSTDLDGIVQAWNRGAERMYGWSSEEAVGKHLSLIVPEDRHDQVEQSLAAVRRGEVERVNSVRRCKNGTLLHVALTISPIRDSSGRVCGASSVARDITEDLWIASQLDSTLAALESALDDARESEAATRRFLDDAAHQLRAPITSIRACAEALARGTLTDERERLIASIVRETSRATRLMTGLLQMARLHHGRKLEPRPCDLIALCRQEAERVRWVAPQIEVTVSEGGSPDQPPVGEVEVDPQAVAEILGNLLDNARRHAMSRIDMVVSRKDHDVHLEVIDDGAGVPEAMVDAVFDRFVSLDALGGSGLGLPIARELARAHGGDVVYGGKAFVLRIPVTAPELSGIEPSLVSGLDAGAMPDR